MTLNDFRPLHRVLFENQRYCDVKFVCEDSEGKSTSIGAHKLILALASDVFDSMFFGESVSRGFFSETNKIEIPGVGAKTLKLFLGYFFHN